ncbi:MAG TPA: CBS domain-containing protein [Clostridia bacterium]|nr:CBS domain-containing protein [Clostridia bacterium]
MNVLSLCDEHPASVPLSATVADAVRAMLELGVGAVAVVDDDNVIAGIFTERDVMRKMVLSGRDASATPIGDVMTTAVVMATADISPADALAVMVNAHHRHLPIADENGKLLGMLSIRNLLQAQIDSLVTQLGTMHNA